MKNKEMKNKGIELSKEYQEILQFLCNRTELVARELSDTQKGEIINTNTVSIESFVAFLSEDLKIYFKRSSSTSYMGEILFYYKNLKILSCIIQSGNKHWNGSAKSIDLSDPYKRESSRHDLEKSFNFFMEWIKKEVYLPITKRISEQELHKDKLYDEFLQIIEH